MTDKQFLDRLNTQEERKQAFSSLLSKALSSSYQDLSLCDISFDMVLNAQMFVETLVKTCEGFLSSTESNTLNFGAIARCNNIMHHVGLHVQLVNDYLDVFVNEDDRNDEFMADLCKGIADEISEIFNILIKNEVMLDEVVLSCEDNEEEIVMNKALSLYEKCKKSDCFKSFNSYVLNLAGLDVNKFEILEVCYVNYNNDNVIGMMVGSVNSSSIEECVFMSIDQENNVNFETFDGEKSLTFSQAMTFLGANNIEITEKDIELFNNGDWFELDVDVLDVLMEREQIEVTSLFNCTSFRAEGEHGKYIIFHPCTKFQGFQVSFFDKFGAIMDIARSTIEELVDEFIAGNYHKAYKIVEVI